MASLMAEEAKGKEKEERIELLRRQVARRMMNALACLGVAWLALVWRGLRWLALACVGFTSLQHFTSL